MIMILIKNIKETDNNKKKKNENDKHNDNINDTERYRKVPSSLFLR